MSYFCKLYPKMCFFEYYNSSKILVFLCVFFQALDKKGIGHLGEKELKDRNKCIQEENRRELQKV